MAQKRKESRLLRKLTEFSYQPAVRSGQNGAAGGTSTAALTVSTSSPQPGQSEHSPYNPEALPHSRKAPQLSPPRSPASSSPAKARMRLDPSAEHSEVSHTPHMPVTLLKQNLPNDSITAFPTMGQPVIDTTLKDMLVSLRSSLQTDMLSIMQNIGHSLTLNEDRIIHIETNVSGITSTVNDIIDTQETHMQETKWIKEKLADIEDRSRRNNIKIRDIGIGTTIRSTLICARPD